MIVKKLPRSRSFTFIETTSGVGPLLSTTLAAREHLRLCLQRRRLHRRRGPILARKRWASGSRQQCRAPSPDQIRAHPLQREFPTKETALTAAKFEAQLIDIIRPRDDREKAAENRRRRWDCFHIATAVELGCEALYAGDKKMLTRKKHLKLGSLKFLPPKPEKPILPFDGQKKKPNGSR